MKDHNLWLSSVSCQRNKHVRAVITIWSRLQPSSYSYYHKSIQFVSDTMMHGKELSSSIRKEPRWNHLYMELGRNRNEVKSGLNGTSVSFAKQSSLKSRLSQRFSSSAMQLRTVIAALGIVELLCAFFMVAMQMCISMYWTNHADHSSLPGCTWPYCDINFHLKFALATHLTSIVAGSTTFLSAGEHFSPSAQLWLLTFSVIIVVANFGETIVLCILKTRPFALGMDIPNALGKHITASDAVYLNSLQIAHLVILYVSLTVLVGLVCLLLVSIVRHRSRPYKAVQIRENPRMFGPSDSQRSALGLEYSLMDNKELQRPKVGMLVS